MSNGVPSAWTHDSKVIILFLYMFVQRHGTLVPRDKYMRGKTFQRLGTPVPVSGQIQCPYVYEYEAIQEHNTYENTKRQNI